MDRLDELGVLVAIIDQGSLAQAARKLRRSPPALTRSLAALEERVGARLIERTTRRLAATEAGRALAERARALIDDYDTAIAGIGDAPLRGLLRVTAPVQFGRRHIAPIVAAFLDIHPRMQIELVLHDRNLDLIGEGLDIAVRIGPLADSTLLVRRVGEVRRLLLASPDYLAAHGMPAKPADLAAHETIFSTAGSGPTEWRFGAATVRLTPRLLVNDIEAQLAAGRGGRGIVRLLSYQVAEELAAGTLVRLLREFEPPPLPVQLVAVGGSHMPPKIRAFLDIAAAALRELPIIGTMAA